MRLVRTLKNLPHLELVDTILGTQTYTDSLIVDTKFDLKWKHGSFSASSDYKRVSKSSETQKTVYTETKATCLTYHATLKPYIM